MDDMEELKQITKVELTNLDKILFPKIHVSKKDVIEYYIKVAPRILPIVKNRPLVLTRYPDGIDSDKLGFYEKNAPEGTPPWIKIKKIYSSSSKRYVHYILCNDIDSLIWIANLAALEIHMPLAKIDNIERPDILLFDIDPEPPAKMNDAIEVALLLKDKLDHLSIDPFIKTSGKKGFHIVAPLVRKYSFKDTREIVHQIGKELAKENHKVVSEFKDTKKPGKVFIDYLQNSSMRTMVIPYSLRPTPQATVSTPLTWDEVRRGLKQTNFNIFSVLKRKKNPWQNFFDNRIKLEKLI